MFSYIPGAGPLNDVRLLIGDVDQNALEDSRLEDADIDRLLTLEGNLRRAAASAADVLAAKFARKAEGMAVGQDRNVISTRSQELRATAARLRANAALGALSFAGGTSNAAKATAEANTDRPAPAFKRGQLDNPDASPAQPQ